MNMVCVPPPSRIVPSCFSFSLILPRLVQNPCFATPSADFFLWTHRPVGLDPLPNTGQFSFGCAFYSSSDQAAPLHFSVSPSPPKSPPGISSRLFCRGHVPSPHRFHTVGVFISCHPPHPPPPPPPPDPPLARCRKLRPPKAVSKTTSGT